MALYFLIVYSIWTNYVFYYVQSYFNAKNILFSPEILLRVGRYSYKNITYKVESLKYWFVFRKLFYNKTKSEQLFFKAMGFYDNENCLKRKYYKFRCSNAGKGYCNSNN